MPTADGSLEPIEWLYEPWVALGALSLPLVLERPEGKSATNTTLVLLLTPRLTPRHGIVSTLLLDSGVSCCFPLDPYRDPRDPESRRAPARYARGPLASWLTNNQHHSAKGATRIHLLTKCPGGRGLDSCLTVGWGCGTNGGGRRRVPKALGNRRGGECSSGSGKKAPRHLRRLAA